MFPYKQAQPCAFLQLKECGSALAAALIFKSKSPRDLNKIYILYI